MWSALVLAASLTVPAQADGTLRLANVRSTYGVLGPTRAQDRLLPGDTLVLGFDIEGISVDASGKVAYSIGTEVGDGKGRVIFKQDPRDLQATTSLGGSRVPAYAELRLGLDQEQGSFIFKVTVTDTAAKKSVSLERPFTVQRKDFGLVRLMTTSDQEGVVPVPVAGVGAPLWVHFGAVGFGRDSATKQPNVTFEIRILGADGKPVSERPLSNTVSKDVPEKLLGLPINFLLSLNRPGSFTVEISAMDKVANKTSKLTFPLTVVESR